MVKSWDKFYIQKTDLSFLIENISVHRQFIEAICNKKPKKILEVGSGTGTMSTFLSYLGFKVVSLDDNQWVLKHAEKVCKSLNGKVEFIKGDAFSLPFADKSFDAVFHQGLLEHFSDKEIQKLLKEQLRVGNVVVFSIPNQNYPQKDIGNERLMDQKEWLKILQQFRVTKSLTYCPDMKMILRNRVVKSVKNMMLMIEVEA